MCVKYVAVVTKKTTTVCGGLANALQGVWIADDTRYGVMW